MGAVQLLWFRRNFFRWRRWQQLKGIFIYRKIHRANNWNCHFLWRLRCNFCSILCSADWKRILQMRSFRTKTCRASTWNCPWNNLQRNNNQRTHNWPLPFFRKQQMDKPKLIFLWPCKKRIHKTCGRKIRAHWRYIQNDSISNKVKYFLSGKRRNQWMVACRKILQYALST